MDNNITNTPCKAAVKTVCTLLLTAFSAALGSCRDEFSLDSLHEEPKLVVYSFPSPASDTTFIEVWKSIPVTQNSPASGQNSTGNSFSINDTYARQPSSQEDGKGARVSYLLNGNRQEVGYHTARQRYFVTCRHQPCDQVEIAVEAEGLPSASAKTTVPGAVPIEIGHVTSVKDFDTDYYEMRDFDQVQAAFTDPAETNDYYAVRVLMMCLHGFAEGGIYTDEENTTWYTSDYDDYLRLRSEHPEASWTWTVTDTTYVYPEISTRNEPLLLPLTDLDEDFGYESLFYDDLYIFSDKSINGQNYTLHLNIDQRYQEGFMQQYQVRLYRLTPEYYRFLQSVNALANNELATIGFSQMAPTFTNVNRGIGVVGAFNRSETIWKKKE